ncbi:MAG: asparagine synthase (glutamine-hydrolyzing) [Bacteroidota bacterium]
MCGFCALLGPKLIDGKSAINSMTHTLSHRGPDAQQTIRLPNAALGHCRLKIIDTSAGSNQPFTDGRYHLIYNGELYNYKQLKEQLLSQGSSFQTDGDTEVLFQWLRQYKSSRLDELDGMFSFLFWDSKFQKGWAARDPMGIKPLYYHFDPIRKQLLLSSELRPLISQLQSVSVDKFRLAEYLQFQSIATPHSLIKGIKSLEPGHLIEYKIGTEPNISLFDAWDQDFHLSTDINDQVQFDQELQNKLRSAIKKRLISDVTRGAFLSGGVDSTVVVAMMRHINASGIKTFTLGFENEDLDERAHARRIASKLETDHSEVCLSEKEIIRKIPQAIQAMDVPSGDAINTYLVAEAAKQAGLTVALSGLGGDELFGGYPSFKGWSRVKKLSKLPFIDTIVNWIPNLDERQKQKLCYAIETGGQPEHWVHSLRSVFLPDWLPPSVEACSQEVPLHQDLTDYQRITIAELNRYTQPLLLNDADQMGMAHALEIRVPLLDRELVGWLGQQSDEYRMAATGHPKWALMRQISDLISPEELNRPKQGFVLPMDDWIRGPLQSYTKSGLFETPITNHLPTTFLDNLWNGFEQATDNRFTWSRVWSVAVLGHWLQKQGIA